MCEVLSMSQLSLFGKTVKFHHSNANDYESFDLRNLPVFKGLVMFFVMRYCFKHGGVILTISCAKEEKNRGVFLRRLRGINGSYGWT